MMSVVTLAATDFAAAERRALLHANPATRKMFGHLTPQNLASIEAELGSSDGDVSYFLVADGHGGASVAEAASTRLLREIAEDAEESTDAYADEPFADAPAELQAGAAAAAPAPAGDVAALEVELSAEQGALAAARSPV